MTTPKDNTNTKTVEVTNKTDTPPKRVNPSTSKPTNNKKFNGPKKFNKRASRKRDTEFEEKVIEVSRVVKVVKGGRRFSFSALVVIGNRKGKISWGHGKANEVPDAIKKAIQNAKTQIITCPIIDKRTVPHEIQAKFLASSVLIKPAPKGKGIIASGSIRAVVELAGYHDIYTKSLGRSRSKTNSVKAAIKALSELRTAKEIAELRNISIDRLLN